jgi:dephospho-CoA kinase
MKVIGITGNLASGKSSVTALFKKRGARVFDADEAARKALKKGSPFYAAVVKIFGRDFLDKKGEIDRRRLAARVFSKPADLKKLNTLLHPGVIIQCLLLIEELKDKEGVLALDVPLLYEARMEGLADQVVVVRSSDKDMIARAVKKGVPRELAKDILASQWPMKKKAAKADFIVDNRGSAADLDRQVGKIWERVKPQKISFSQKEK